MASCGGVYSGLTYRQVAILLFSTSQSLTKLVYGAFVSPNGRRSGPDLFLFKLDRHGGRGACEAQEIEQEGGEIEERSRSEEATDSKSQYEGVEMMITQLRWKNNAGSGMCSCGC